MNTVENNMETLVDSMVVVKFKNGRAISGLLRKELEGSFTIKLGTKFIPIASEEVVRIVRLA